GGAEGDAQGHFAGARAGAAEEQAGDVGAGNQEDDTDEAHEERDERGVWRGMADAGLEFGFGGYGEALIAFWKLLLEAAPESGEFRLRGLARHAGLETRFDGVGMIPAVFEWVGRG